MSRYHIEVSPLALAGLAEAYVAAVRRGDVTTASERAERRLSVDPRRDVEHLSEGLYAVSEPPLRVVFEVDEQNRTVSFAAVRLLPDFFADRQEKTNGRPP